MKIHPPGRLAAILPWPGNRTEDYNQAIAVAEERLQRHARVLAAERAEAPNRLAELLAQPAERREMLLRNHPRFQTWGLLERLIERMREDVFEHPEREDLAQLGLSLADCLDADYYGSERVEDLRARLWGYLGNARRVKSDFAGAEKAFERALAHLAHGTGDSLERALLLDLRASLLRDRRLFDAALRYLARALRVYLEVGETHRAGRVLIKMSTVHEHAGTPEHAIPLLHQAVKLIDAEREPRLLLSAHHNLITNLAEAGRFMDAHGLFIQARPLYARFPDCWTQNRRHWVEGKIARGLGQPREAETLLRTARNGFAAESSAFDAALVSLDLATLYAEQGRTADVKQIAQEMLAIFSSRQIHREALAALSFLRQAAVAERASLELVTGVTQFLKHLQNDPNLAFVQPAAS